MTQQHTNIETGRGVMVTSYVLEGASEIERRYEVCLLVYKPEYNTWAGYNSKNAQDKYQAEEWFTKAVTWSGRT